MKTIETIVEETVVPIKAEVRAITTEYKGLKLIEDKPYQGPTSIKYWM